MYIVPGGGVPPEKLGRGVPPTSKTLTLFMTKICDFCYPIYDLAKNRDPIYDQNGWKTLSFLVAHTYIAHIREYPWGIVLCPKHSSDHYVPHHCYVLDTLVLDWILIAFDEVERKPNFDLWLFRVGLPVHGSRPKKTTFL